MLQLGLFKVFLHYCTWNSFDDPTELVVSTHHQINFLPYVKYIKRFDAVKMLWLAQLGPGCVPVSAWLPLA